VSSAPVRRLTARLGRLPFPLAAPSWPDSVPRPNPERRTGLAYDHDWSRRYPVRLARAVVTDNVARPVARLLAPTTVRGLEHLRHLEAPVIFAANHTSHVDTPLLLSNLPLPYRHHTVVAAASDYFFDRTWKAALYSFALAAIPIERTRVNRASADLAAELLDDGWSLVIFPDGGRSPAGWAQPFRGGAAYLARRTGRPVVPVYLHGTRQITPKRPTPGVAPGGSGTEGRHGPGLRRSPVSLVFGAPIAPAEGEDARRFSARVEQAVALLRDEVATDWWTARRRAAHGTAPSARGPDASSWRRAWALGPPPGRPADQDESSTHPWPPRHPPRT
jgi:1-acyl-sn-glycerol-3-phosphate acyltransferase